MGHKKDDTAKKIAIGGVIAAIVGFLAGILTAPKSGKQTRQDIKDTADKGKDEAEKELQKLHAELDKAIEQAKSNKTKLSQAAQEEFNELVDRAKDSKEKAREVLGAVREGNANDKDLDRAVKTANRSLKHLKKYLTK